MAFKSGTFLKSKVAQRIAILLLVAAIIPATLVTGLTYRNMSRLLHNVEQESLVNSSQDYALDAFANLIFARTMLQHFAAINPHESTNTVTLWEALEEKTTQLPIFKSVVQITNQGQIIAQHGNANHLATAIGQQNATEFASLNAKNLHFRLLVLWQKKYQTPLISLILPRTSQENTLTIAELNPDFIWGIKSDYPSEINVCAYQTLGKLKSKLFCTQENLPLINSKQSLPSSSWELFLKAEFQGEPWTFETTRLKPSAANKLWDFYSDNGFIWVLVLSLLIIGLLSINQIRRTMVPLEHLIAGTRKISKGQFDQVVINDKSEFSELANAFNHMSSDIQRQLNTLQVLSDVDKKMVAKLDVDYLI